MTLQSLCASMSSAHIRTLIDNTTAVHKYINKMVGMKENLNDITREVILWCKQRNIWLAAAHLPGSKNVEADFESRNQNEDTEWSLDKKCFQRVTNCFGQPDIDLFAFRLNHQLPVYSSYKPDPNAKFVDVFSEH